MPCAWDAGSARLFESLGFPALGTTSGGVNWSRGRPDYVYAVSSKEMLNDYRLIASSVAVPVSGDLENGYGSTAHEVADTVKRSIRMGMVGGSIEDRAAGATTIELIPALDAAARIASARTAADSLLPDYVLTARAESFFAGLDDPMGDAIHRANLYAEAGADCIFIPGPADPRSIAELVERIPLPISVGIGSGGGTLTVPVLAETGVRRVSSGGALPRLLFERARQAATEMLDRGSFTFAADTFDESELNALMGGSSS